MSRRIFFAALTVVSGYSLIAADNFFNAAEFQNAGTDARPTDDNVSTTDDVITLIAYQDTDANNAAQLTAGMCSSFDTAYRLREMEQIDGAMRANNDCNRHADYPIERCPKSISVNVDEVLPNGDLLISGNQVLYINGEATAIEVSGLIRRDEL